MELVATHVLVFDMSPVAERTVVNVYAKKVLCIEV
jgi:hypothetical protein